MNVNDIFPTKYVKAADLQGKDVTLTMRDASLEEMGIGADKELKLVLWFRGTAKGLIMNRTNTMIVAKLYGPNTDLWVNNRITIYATTVSAFGKRHDVIRVREQAPPPPKPAASAEAAQPAGEVVSEVDDADDYLDGDDGHTEAATGQAPDPAGIFDDTTPYYKSAYARLTGNAYDLVQWASQSHKVSAGPCDKRHYKLVCDAIDAIAGSAQHVEILSILCQCDISEANKPGVNVTKFLIPALSPTVFDATHGDIPNNGYKPQVVAAVSAIAQPVRVAEPA